MPEKQPSPLSIRLKPEVVERVEAWAVERGLNRNAAVVALIERGLAEDAQARPFPRDGRAKVYVTAGGGKSALAGATLQLGPSLSKPGSRLKGSK